ncbi:MAG: peptidyl-prolyl cis-trans isomerase [Hespellia sp.]|nr:peptidyl-prolyl cis-trans isomerase [Hespellia sp.]
MNRFGKKAVVLGMVAALAVSSLSGCTKLKDTDVVATVGKDEVSAGVANFYARLQQAQYESYYSSFMGEDMWSEEAEEGKTYEESVKSSLLELLENMYLLEQHMDEYEVALTEDEQKTIKDAANKFVEANALEDKNIVSGSKENAVKVLELLTIQSKMKTAMEKGVDEEVSDEEAAQKSMNYVQFTYTTTDENGESAQMTDEEKAAQQKKAQEFADSVKDTKDLKKDAEAAGYEVQTATFDSKSTNPEADVIAAADAVEKEGGLTSLITTDYGCYICQVTSFLDRAATDTKKTSIVEERKEAQYQDLLDQWREDTDITEDKKVWAKISFDKQGVTMKETEEEPYAVGSDGTTDEDDVTTSEDAK